MFVALFPTTGACVALVVTSRWPHKQLTNSRYIGGMSEFPPAPCQNAVSNTRRFRWLFGVHVGFAVLWALLNLVVVGGGTLIGDFAGATVDVDPPEGGFPFPIGMFLILAVPAMLHLLLAWGAHHRAHWVRKGTMGIGLTTMLLFPVGTLFGLYLVCISGRDLQSRGDA